MCLATVTFLCVFRYGFLGSNQNPGGALKLRDFLINSRGEILGRTYDEIRQAREANVRDTIHHCFAGNIIDVAGLMQALYRCFIRATNLREVTFNAYSAALFANETSVDADEGRI